MTDKKVVTDDGSITFHSSEYDETYHSTSGALTEADKKYAEVCGIREMNSVDVLDICFGLGYNSAAAIDRFAGKRINIVGLEQYEGIVSEIVRMGAKYPFKCREIMQIVAEKKEYSDEKVKIKLIMGDARKTIIQLPNSAFDCVFLDPFSPKKCPELWTKEFFDEIYRVLRSGGKVATYSCARIVRDNFVAAGFSVSDGPCVGRRAPGTVAVKD